MNAAISGECYGFECLGLVEFDLPAMNATISGESYCPKDSGLRTRLLNVLPRARSKLLRFQR
jgi:hypothetical protein